jgi:hypothetical protein
LDIKEQNRDNLNKKGDIDHTDNKIWLISQIEKTLEAYHNTLQSSKGNVLQGIKAALTHNVLLIKNSPNTE